MLHRDMIAVMIGIIQIGPDEVNLFLARGRPQFLKERSVNAGANENLSCGFPPSPGIAPGVAPRILVFVRRHSENGISHSENFVLN